MAELASKIRDIPDFPKPGILFKALKGRDKLEGYDVITLIQF